MKRQKTIERLIIYKILLEKAFENGEEYIYSHQIAAAINATSSQVRRDIMEIGYTGSQKYGYNIQELMICLKDFLESPQPVFMILAGVGNLGQAVLRYFMQFEKKYSIVATFDVDKSKIDTFILQCKCHAIDKMSEIIKKQNILSGIITVPAESAQYVADLMIEAGIKGIINFAPVRIITPEDVFVENINISLAIDKVIYFTYKIDKTLTSEK